MTRRLLIRRYAAAICIAASFSLHASDAHDELASKSLHDDKEREPLPKQAMARLGSTSFFHASGIMAATFTPDGVALVTVPYPDAGRVALRFWATATGKELGRVEVAPAPGDSFDEVTQVQFAPAGNTVALTTPYGVALLDARSGKRLRPFAAGAETISCAFSPDGKQLAIGCMVRERDNPIRVWDTATGRELAPFPGFGSSLQSLTFSGDGARLFSGPAGTRFQQADSAAPIRTAACVWDVASRRRLRVIDSAHGPAAFARNGSFLAYDYGNAIHVVASTAGAEVCRIPLANASFAFTRDGASLISLSPTDGLSLWDAGTGKRVRQFTYAAAAGDRLVGFSPDGTRLAVICSAGRHGDSVRLWDVATGVESRGRHGSIRHLAYAPNGKLLASAGGDGTVRLWRLDSSTEVRRYEGHKAAVLAVAFAPDGTVLASTGADGTTRLWDVASGTPRGVLSRGSETAAGMLEGAAVAFAPDGKTLTAVDNGGTLVTWDLAARRPVRVVSLGHPSVLVSSVPAVVPWRPLVVVGLASDWQPGVDDAVPPVLALWNHGTGRCVRPMMPVETAQARARVFVYCNAVAASADARIVASTQRMETTDFTRPRQLVTLRERFTGVAYRRIDFVSPQCLALSHDGELLAGDDRASAGGSRDAATLQNALSGQGDDRASVGAAGGPRLAITLWDAVSGQVVIQLRGHTAAIQCIAFAPDGAALASGSADGIILVWKMAPLPRLDQSAATPAQLRLWWDDLASSNAAKAVAAGRNLIASGDRAVDLIRAHLRPAPALGAPRAATLVRDLQNAEFEVRDRARRQIEEWEECAEVALRQALAAAPNLEARRRIAALLTRAASVPPAQWQSLRAVAVLERIGSLKAREALATLADGCPEARLTQEAGAALHHLRSQK